MYNQTGTQVRWNGSDHFLYSGFYSILFTNNVRVFLTNHWFPNKLVMYFIHWEKMMLLFQLELGYILQRCSCLNYWWDNFIVEDGKKMTLSFLVKNITTVITTVIILRGDFIILLMLSAWTIKWAMFCF